MMRVSSESSTKRSRSKGVSHADGDAPAAQHSPPELPWYPREAEDTRSHTSVMAAASHRLTAEHDLPIRGTAEQIESACILLARALAIGHAAVL